MKVYNAKILSLDEDNSKHMDKKDLIALLEHKHSAPFLFIGSGFSKHYLNTPKWDELLQSFSKNHINSYYTKKVFASCFISTTCVLNGRKVMT